MNKTKRKQNGVGGEEKRKNWKKKEMKRNEKTEWQRKQQTAN